MAEELITNAFVHFKINQTVTDPTIPGNSWTVTSHGSLSPVVVGDNPILYFVTFDALPGFSYNPVRDYTVTILDGDHADEVLHVVRGGVNNGLVFDGDQVMMFEVSEAITNAAGDFDFAPLGTALLFELVEITGETRTETTDYPFAIDPASYVKRDVVDFAPRAGGGDVAYSNLDLYQIITQDSFHHGFGFVQFRDKFGYRITETASAPDAYITSCVDTRHIGMAMLWTKYSGEINAGFSIKSSVDFGSSVYFDCGPDGVWKRASNGSWSQVLVANISDLKSNGSYLMASIVSGRMKVSADGTTWVDAGVSGNPPVNFGSIEIHNGFMWASEASTDFRTITGACSSFEVGAFGSGISIYGDGTLFLTELKVGDKIRVGTSWVASVVSVVTNTRIVVYTISGTPETGSISVETFGVSYNVLHFWASADSSDAEGGGINDIAAIQIGSGGYDTKRLLSFNGSLYAARIDGVWAIDETVAPPVARRVLNFSSEISSTNFDIFIAWRGRLYFNIGNMLYAYNGSSLADVTPPTYDLNFPPGAFGAFRGAAYRGPYLYILATPNSATRVHLLAFDGTGWFRLTDGLTGSSSGLMGLSYSALTNRLFMGDRAQIISFQFQAGSELPYANFGNPSLYNSFLNLSEIDYGFRRVVKSFAEIDIEVYNVAVGRYVAVDYSADNGEWYRLGYTTQNGVTAMMMNPTVEANKLDVRFDFQTSDQTQSPILRNFAIKAMVRPAVLYSHRFVIIGADLIQMLDGLPHTLSSEEQHGLLESFRDSRAPVTYVDPFGIEHEAYVSAVTFSNIERRPQEHRSNWKAQVNIVEVR